MIDKVRRLPQTQSLRAAIDEASRAAREIAQAEAGRAIDAPRGTYAEKLAARRRVHVAGLKGSSTVFLAEAIRQALGRSVLLVYPDDEAAQDDILDLVERLRSAPGAREVVREKVSSIAAWTDILFSDRKRATYGGDAEVTELLLHDCERLRAAIRGD